MYYLVFFILLWFSFVELFLKRRNSIWSYSVFALMTFMAMFRYGQLTDYFNYREIYDYPETAGITDPLYFLLTNFFKSLGFDYQVFVMFASIITMGLSYPFFFKVCKGSILALLVFYSYVFLILPMSAVRQGICLSMMLYGFVLLLKGKIRTYYLLILIGVFIHFSMFVCGLIPLLYKKKIFNCNTILWVIFGVTCFSLLSPDLSTYLPEYLAGKSLGEYGESKFLQVLIRFLLIIPVVFVRPDYGSKLYYAKAICIVGYFVYCLLSFIPTAAARLEFYFRIFLCLYVACIVLSKRRFYLSNLMIGSILALHVFLFFKNMNAAIKQGEYNEKKVSMFNFPYVSIFDKEELELYK